MYQSNLRLRELRKSKKESGNFVAKILNISPQYYYDLELGKRTLNIDIAKKLAKHFSVSIDYLVGYENNDTIEKNTLFQQNEYVQNIELMNVLQKCPFKDLAKLINIIKAFVGD